MKPCALFLGLIAALLAPSPVVAAPLATTNHWRAFTKADGLPENSCVSLTVGASGNILVRHAKSAGISLFDGYEFTTVPAPGTNRGRIYESPGGQLWTVAPAGLLEFREDEWSPHPVPQIAAHFRAGQTSEVRLQPVRHGRVLIFLPAETLQLDASDPEQAQLESLAPTNQITPARGPESLPEIFSVRRVFDQQTEPGGAVWFATSDGLFRHTRELWEADVAAGVPPAVEPGFQPGGKTVDLAKIIGSSDTFPGGKMPPSTSGGTPAATVARGSWKSFLTTQTGDVWLGGAHAIAWRHQHS